MIRPITLSYRIYLYLQVIGHIVRID